MKTAGMNRQWADPAERRQISEAASTAHRRYSGRRWNWFVVRGGLSLVAGLTLLFFAFSPFTLVALLLGAFLALDAIFSILAGLDGVKTIQGKASARILRGTIGLVASLTLILLAILASSAMIVALMLLALWAIATGSIDFAIAANARRRLDIEWMPAAAGLSSVIVGAATPFLALSAAQAPEYGVILLFAVLLIGAGLLLAGHGLGLDSVEGEVP